MRLRRITRKFAGVWLKLWLDVDDGRGTDCGEQTGLRIGSTLWVMRRARKRTKIKVVLKSSLYFCIYSVSYSVVSCLYTVERSSWVIVLDGQKIHPEGLLDAVPGQPVGHCDRLSKDAPSRVDIVQFLDHLIGHPFRD